MYGRMRVLLAVSILVVMPRVSSHQRNSDTTAETGNALRPREQRWSMRTAPVGRLTSFGASNEGASNVRGVFVASVRPRRL